ncbi:hypothetical protein Pcinc_039222 [Petrolisthes cinctipes]|uniref:Uncharacterized protein n=1 Tax=Petrolisthes cinctipes TaxID=88211 RepID=A0AAE1BKV5_PETCI|nr:hypothetical protein Pcinc_040785 [Petrolisthes cinctipes]KAK3854281.1 hypothetical protein Pcinc_039222 [Petrolisthes cinctipes]
MLAHLAKPTSILMRQEQRMHPRLVSNIDKSFEHKDEVVWRDLWRHKDTSVGIVLAEKRYNMALVARAAHERQRQRRRRRWWQRGQRWV